MIPTDVPRNAGAIRGDSLSPASEGLGGGAGPAWPIRVQDRASEGGARHPVEVPRVGDALQLVLACVLEREAGAGDKILDR